MATQQVVIRSQSKVEVLDGGNGSGIVVRSGVFDDGRKWEVREVTVVDAARNKAKVRVSDAVPHLAPGFYNLTLEATVTGAARVDVVAAEPAK